MFFTSGASCTLPQSDCSPGCNCLWYNKSDTITGYCAGAALRTLPLINNVSNLIAADNRIANIQPDVLPDSLQVGKKTRKKHVALNLGLNIIRDVLIYSSRVVFGTEQKNNTSPSLPCMS
jgi:hypothetical protein